MFQGQSAREFAADDPSISLVDLTVNPSRVGSALPGGRLARFERSARHPCGNPSEQACIP